VPDERHCTAEATRVVSFSNSPAPFPDPLLRIHGRGEFGEWLIYPFFSIHRIPPSSARHDRSFVQGSLEPVQASVYNDLPSVRLSVCPSVRPCPSVRLSVCPSVRLSVCPSVRPSGRLNLKFTTIKGFWVQFLQKSKLKINSDILRENPF
jgi:hypothetical protein